MEKEKTKKTLLEILRFLFAGLIATIFDFIFYEICLYFVFKKLETIEFSFLFVPSNLNITLSTAVGFIIGNIVNFILNIKFVFKSENGNQNAKNAKSFIIFTIIGILGLLLKIVLQNGGNNLISLIYHGNIKFWLWFFDTAVYGISTIIVFVWNYIGRKLFIFNEKKMKVD